MKIKNQRRIPGRYVLVILMILCLLLLVLERFTDSGGPLR